MGARHVILDRDGVVLKEGDAPLTLASELQWEDNALEALRSLARAGVAVSVVTNQSCIAAGQATREQIDAVHAALQAQAAEAGGRIDRVLLCPHGPQDSCTCRTPAPALVEEAIRRSGVPNGETVLVGDDLRALEAGHRCGLRVALVRTGKGKAVEEVWRRREGDSAQVFDNLAEVLPWALEGPVAEVDAERRRRIERVFAQHAELIEQSRRMLPASLLSIASRAIECLRSGGKLMICGNGGSAADAQHFASEIVAHLSSHHRALPAIALGSPTSSGTSRGADDGVEQVFARQLAALAKSGDLLLALSTSGRSANIIEAVRAARVLGCATVGLTGWEGGKLARMVDLVVRVPSSSVPRIQEVHALCLHALAEIIQSSVAQPGPQRD